MRSPGTRHRWKGLLLETAVVVTGILIAFALDSWWDSRAQAFQERAHLRALQSDFAANDERLDESVARQDGIIAASRQLLVLSRIGRPVAIDTVRTLMSRVFNSGRFEPVMGAYEAVVNSGGLAQISDDSLRAALAAFTSYLRVPYVEQYSNSLYFPFIREYADRMWFPWIDPAAEDSTPAGLQPQDWPYMELLRDRRFQAQVALRMYAERDVGRYYQALHEQAKTILALLDRPLQR